MPSDEDPSVFSDSSRPQCILCPICFWKTYLHDKLSRFRHSYAWHVGTLCNELEVPRQRCIGCLEKTRRNLKGEKKHHKAIYSKFPNKFKPIPFA